MATRRLEIIDSDGDGKVDPGRVHWPTMVI